LSLSAGNTFAQKEPVKNRRVKGKDTYREGFKGNGSW
jgi:hypothetical protein